MIGDFGTSKLLSSASALGSTLVGSPLNMSPEMLENEPHSFATDIWSLGCILYELLTGQPAFAAPSYPAVVYKITQGTYPPLGATISLHVRELVARMLQKDQHARPTIHEILLKMDVLGEQSSVSSGGGGHDETQAVHEHHDDIEDGCGEAVVPSVSLPPVDPSGPDASDLVDEVSSLLLSVLPPPAPIELTVVPEQQPVEAAEGKHGVPSSGGQKKKKKSKPSAVAVLPNSRARIAQVRRSLCVGWVQTDMQRMETLLTREWIISDRIVRATSHASPEAAAARW